MVEDINAVNEMYREIVPYDIRDKYMDITKYPLIYGYNIFTSYRSGGKTTNVLLWSLCCNALYGSKIAVVRTNKTMITTSKISTMFDTILNTVDDFGKNYIEKIYNDKYNRIMYLSRERRFVLCTEETTDYTKCETIAYVVSIDQQDDLRSGFADNSLDIVLYDEMIDKKVQSDTFIQFCHMLSTFFRQRYKSVVFMNCNMSTGNPVVLQSMGIYEKVLGQTDEYKMYTTKHCTRIGVRILAVSDSFSGERSIMNETFFGFDCEGMDIIRGTSIVYDTYRKIPQNVEYVLADTNVYCYACGVWIKFHTVYCEGWQTMIYAEEITYTPSGEDIVIMTDDKKLAFNNPRTYASICKDFSTCVQIAKMCRRGDICYSSYMAYVALNSFYDFYKIGDFI